MRRDDVPHTARSGQKIVQRCDHLRTLTHRRGDTFDRARADIADCEYAWTICFQQVAIAAGLDAGQHKSFAIKRYAGSIEPIRVRIRPDKEEKVAMDRRASPDLTCQIDRCLAGRVAGRKRQVWLLVRGGRPIRKYVELSCRPHQEIAQRRGAHANDKSVASKAPMACYRR